MSPPRGGWGDKLHVGSCPREGSPTMFDLLNRHLCRLPCVRAATSFLQLGPSACPLRDMQVSATVQPPAARERQVSATVQLGVRPRNGGVLPCRNSRSGKNRKT